MVVAPLVERLLPRTEVCGSNPVIRKLYLYYQYTVNCIEKTNIKKKEAGIGPIKKDEFERIEFNPRIYKILFSMFARMSQQHVPFAVLV